MKTVTCRVCAGVSLLLGGLPLIAPAQPGGTPHAQAAPQAQTLQWYSLTLTNVTPSAMLAKLGPAAQIAGLSRIYGLEGDKRLLIQATPDGLHTVKARLSALDVPQTAQPSAKTSS